jgi:hypothetical protein
VQLAMLINAIWGLPLLNISAIMAAFLYCMYTLNYIPDKFVQNLSKFSVLIGACKINCEIIHAPQQDLTYY